MTTLTDLFDDYDETEMKKIKISKKVQYTEKKSYCQTPNVQSNKRTRRQPTRAKLTYRANVTVTSTGSRNSRKRKPQAVDDDKLVREKARVGDGADAHKKARKSSKNNVVGSRGRDRESSGGKCLPTTTRAKLRVAWKTSVDRERCATCSVMNSQLADGDCLTGVVHTMFAFAGLYQQLWTLWWQFFANDERAASAHLPDSIGMKRLRGVLESYNIDWNERPLAFQQPFDRSNRRYERDRKAKYSVKDTMPTPSIDNNSKDVLYAGLQVIIGMQPPKHNADGTTVGGSAVKGARNMNEALVFFSFVVLGSLPYLHLATHRRAHCKASVPADSGASIAIPSLQRIERDEFLDDDCDNKLYNFQCQHGIEQLQQQCDEFARLQSKETRPRMRSDYKTSSTGVRKRANEIVAKFGQSATSVHEEARRLRMAEHRLCALLATVAGERLEQQRYADFWLPKHIGVEDSQYKIETTLQTINGTSSVRQTLVRIDEIGSGVVGLTNEPNCSAEQSCVSASGENEQRHFDLQEILTFKWNPPITESDNETCNDDDNDTTTTPIVLTDSDALREYNIADISDTDSEELLMPVAGVSDDKLAQAHRFMEQADKLFSGCMSPRASRTFV